MSCSYDPVVKKSATQAGWRGGGRQRVSDAGAEGCDSMPVATVPVVANRRNPSARMEAITSRPLLLAAAGRAAHSGGQTTPYLTPMHGKANRLKPLIANTHPALQHVKAAAEQFKSADRWAVLLRHVSDKIAPTLESFRPPAGLRATG